MWHSEEDFIKDIASLNDFGIPGDKEPYKVLYSNGRGTRPNHKPKSQKPFIDPRTGEAINVSSQIFEVNKTPPQGSKGRGSAIGSLTKIEFQLQKQLRLARPLGSSDEAIETYCKRNKPIESILKNKSAPPATRDSSSCSSDAQNSTSTQVSDMTEKPQKRVKATRSSKSQNNALMAGLLSKNIKDIQSPSEKGSINSENLEKKECEDDSVSVEESCDSSTDTSETSNSNVETCKDKHFNNETENQTHYIKPFKGKLINNGVNESTSSHNEKPSWLHTFGEKFSKSESRSIIKQISQSFSSTLEEPYNPETEKVGFLKNDQDFPPLHRN